MNETKEFRMKKLTAVLVIFLCTLLNVNANETVRLSVGEWVPYTSADVNKGRVGQSIVTAAFKLENIDVVYEYNGWQKSFKDALEAKSEGTFPWSKSKERLKDFYYSKLPIAKSKTVFFSLKKTNFNWAEYEDLKKYKFGDVTGFKASKFLMDKGINVINVDTEAQNMKKLLSGEIDVTTSGYLVGNNLIKTLFTAEEATMFTSHEKAVFKETGFYIIISKKHPRGQELMKIFDKGFLKLLRSGQLVKIMKASMK